MAGMNQGVGCGMNPRAQQSGNPMPVPPVRTIPPMRPSVPCGMPSQCSRPGQCGVQPSCGMSGMPAPCSSIPATPVRPAMPVQPGASMQTKDQLMRQINEASFAMDDVLLFLDTHPNNMEALQYYRNVSAMRKNALAAYQSQFGPLLVDDVTGNSWTWVTEKWPWEGGC